MPVRDVIEGIPTIVKASAGFIVAVAGIIGVYTSVNSWAVGLVQDAKDEMRQEQAVASAKQDLIHDKMYQKQQLDYNETQLHIAELELEKLEAEPEPRARDVREMERLREAIASYDEQIRKARENLESIEQPN